jgi:hypothetical protein
LSHAFCIGISHDVGDNILGNHFLRDRACLCSKSAPGNGEPWCCFLCVTSISLSLHFQSSSSSLSGYL